MNVLASVFSAQARDHPMYIRDKGSGGYHCDRSGDEERRACHAISISVNNFRMIGKLLRGS